jgi:hypothetical protein
MPLHTVNQKAGDASPATYILKMDAMVPRGHRDVSVDVQQTS